MTIFNSDTGCRSESVVLGVLRGTKGFIIWKKSTTTPASKCLLAENQLTHQTKLRTVTATQTRWEYLASDPLFSETLEDVETLKENTAKKMRVE